MTDHPPSDAATALQDSPAWVQWRALNDAWSAPDRRPMALSALDDLAHRHSEALWAALPPRYRPVLLGLLDRLEAGALFTEESCSYSPRDLQDQVSAWLGHAQRHLQRMPGDATIQA